MFYFLSGKLSVQIQESALFQAFKLHKRLCHAVWKNMLSNHLQQVRYLFLTFATCHISEDLNVCFKLLITCLVYFMHTYEIIHQEMKRWDIILFLFFSGKEKLGLIYVLLDFYWTTQRNFSPWPLYYSKKPKLSIEVVKRRKVFPTMPPLPNGSHDAPESEQESEWMRQREQDLLLHYGFDWLCIFFSLSYS